MDIDHQAGRVARIVGGFLILLGTLFAVSVPAAEALEEQTPVEETDSLVESVKTGPTEVVERELNANRIQYVEELLLKDGTTQFRTNQYTQLEDGLNYADENGVLTPANDTLEIVDGAAVGLQAQLKVRLAGNIAEPGSLQVTLPSGALLASHVYGLAYVDSATGESVLLATVRNTEGILVGQNQVHYLEAFDGEECQADLRYTFTKASIEQDVVFRQSPRPPEDFGLSSASTRLEVWTEFIEAPEPSRAYREALYAAEEGKAALPEPAKILTDEVLRFADGARIGPGLAFPLGAGQSRIDVAKTWVTIEESEEAPKRTFLIEAVPIPVVAAKLDELPKGAQARRIERIPSRNTALAALPVRQKDDAFASYRIKHASQDRKFAFQAQPGFVIDFTLGTTHTDFTALGNETYHVTATTTFGGAWIKLEGGATFKFASGAKIIITVPITWRANKYRPLILTAESDRSVGKIIAGTASAPPNRTYYANTAIEFQGDSIAGAFTAKYMRISYATTGVYLNGGVGHDLRHVQFVNCETAIRASALTPNGPNPLSVSLFNALVYKDPTWAAGSPALVHSVFSQGIFGPGSSGYSADIQHLTTDNIEHLQHPYSTGSATLINCLFYYPIVSGMSLGTLNGSGGYTWAAANSFQAVQGGKHYLAGATYRNQGTTAINPALKTDLKQMTTYAPTELIGQYSGNKPPVATRDTDADGLDLGYHYLPLDYVAKNVVVDGLLAFTDGATVATFGGAYGFQVGDSDILSWTGKGDNLSRLVLAACVQEAMTSDGSNLPGPMLRLIGGAAGSPRSMIRFKFTDVVSPGRIHPFWDTEVGSVYSAVLDHLTAEHSQFRAIEITAVGAPYSLAGAPVPVISLKNCLVERGAIKVTQHTASGHPNPYTVYLLNNTTFASSLIFNYNNLGTAPNTRWEFRRNLFHSISKHTSINTPLRFTAALSSDKIARSHNGFSSVHLPLVTYGYDDALANDPAGTDVDLGATGVSFIGIDERPWRQKSPFQMRNMGGILASTAGLYHSTTVWSTTGDLKDGEDPSAASPANVDIGYHYVALNSSGLPIDSNSNGTADYLEDADGDRLLDSWENTHGLLTDPAATETDDFDGDGSSNYAEYLAGTDPSDNFVIGWGLDTTASTAPPGLGSAAVTGTVGVSLGLRPNKSVQIWGNDPAGALEGIVSEFAGTGLSSSNPSALAIAAMYEQAAAVKLDGSLVNWGKTFGPLPSYSALNPFTVVALANFHGAAARQDGTVVIWGDYNYNAPSDLASVKQIFGGENHYVVLSNVDGNGIGRARAWGERYDVYNWALTPAPTDVGSGIKAVASGANHILALRSDGTVRAWGAGSSTGNGPAHTERGQSQVPSGLSGVVAIAAGGYNSLALKSDQTVKAWGDLGEAPAGLNRIVGIGASTVSLFAERTGRQTPVIIRQPVTGCVVQNTIVNLSAEVRGPVPNALQYQWQLNGEPIPGANTKFHTVTIPNPGPVGAYRVVVSNGAGSTASSLADLMSVSQPSITQQTPSVTSLTFFYGDTLNLNVVAANNPTCPHPLRYKWYINGVHVTTVVNAAPGSRILTINDGNFSAPGLSVRDSGSYRVVVENDAGGQDENEWQVTVMGEGYPYFWGSLASSTTVRKSIAGLTNATAMSAGLEHLLILKDDGKVTAYPTTFLSQGQNLVPPSLAGVTSVAAGDRHSLAVDGNGIVQGWGDNAGAQVSPVPTPPAGHKAVSVSAGGHTSLALYTDGTVRQFGVIYESPLPAAVLNPAPPHVKAIASGATVHFALLDKKLIPWGQNVSAKTAAPTSLNNLVAIAAAGQHALALDETGKVHAWGSNADGESTVPAEALTGVMAIAAGTSHSVALKNDGTIVAWGRNVEGQRNTHNMGEVKFIAAGGNSTLASPYSPWTEYPVDVERDVLIVFNSLSSDSIAVKNHYLLKRPPLTAANLKPIACDVGEFVSDSAGLPQSKLKCKAQILDPIVQWYTDNPTKHPRYIILCYDIPTRVSGFPLFPSTSETFGSISYRLRESILGWKPFVNHLNAGSLIDCKKYIDKLETMAGSPGDLFISANYPNAEYVVDDVTWNPMHAAITPGANAEQTLRNSFQVNPSDITYAPKGTPFITSAANVTGYLTWGYWGNFNGNFALDGTVSFSGDSDWYIMKTIESYSGWRGVQSPDQSNFWHWFSANAFGGSNYSRTAVGAICSTEEPYGSLFLGGGDFLGQWAARKPFAICAWSSVLPIWVQVVGDPFVKR